MKMKDRFKKKFFLGVMIFVSATTTAVPVNDTARRAKFLNFAPDDILLDMFEGVDDTLPVTVNKFYHKEQYSGTNTKTTEAVTSTAFPTSSKKPAKINKIKTKEVANVTMKNDSLTSDNSSDVFELATDYFSYPISEPHPHTEKSIVIYENTDDAMMIPTTAQVNLLNSSEHYKIWWSAVGDTIKKIPFLPLHLNVPDMLSTMIHFFMAYMPFINQLGNVNHPRPRKNKTRMGRPKIRYYDYDYSNYRLKTDLQDNGRDFQVETDDTLTRKETKIKRKGNKRKKDELRNNSKKFFHLPSFTKPTTVPPGDTKLWGGLGDDHKDTMKVKNMSLNKKRIRVADKEWFNFKNSDINNSPIMIVNVPQRPITQFKIYQNIPQMTGSGMGGGGGPAIPGLPGLPIPGIPGLPIPGTGGGQGGGSGSPATASVNISHPITAGVTQNTNYKEKKDEVSKFQKPIGRMVLKTAEKLTLKQRRKVKSKRKATKPSKRTVRSRNLEPKSKNYRVTVP